MGLRKTKNVWVYNIKSVKNLPRLKKILHPKVKYIDTDGNKFTSIEAAKRKYKNLREYRNRKNKPVIRIVVNK